LSFGVCVNSERSKMSPTLYSGSVQWDTNYGNGGWFTYNTPPPMYSTWVNGLSTRKLYVVWPDPEILTVDLSCSFGVKVYSGRHTFHIF